MDAMLPSLSRPAPEPPDASGKRYYFALIWAGLTFLACLGATLVVWDQSRTTEQGAAKTRFDFAANTLVNEVTDRLDTHVQTLWGAAGLLAAHPNVTRAQWRAFVDGLKLSERLSDTRAIGFAKRVRASEADAFVREMRAQGFPDFHIWPPSTRDEFVVVTFVEPRDGPSLSLGYDVMTLQDRVTTLEQARDTGLPVVSPKLKLLREPQTDPQPGFLLFLPIYGSNVRVDTVAERRAAIVGYAYIPFRANDFIMSKAIADLAQRTGIAFEIYDGPVPREADLLYRSARFPSVLAAVAPAHMTTIAEIVGGRTWTFRVASVKPFHAEANAEVPYLILASGMLVSLLASAVVGALAANRAQAMEANRKLRADVARREQVEEKLRRSETKFRQLFDNIPLPTFAIDRQQHRYIEVNEAAVAKYGYSHAEFARMNIHDIRPEEDVPKLIAYLDSMRDRDRYGGEFRHRLRDGRVIEVEVTGRNLELDGRQSTIVIAHDITERKQAQAALAESELQLRQSQKLEAIGQLTGGIAHDFNNILTVVTGTIEILADGVAHDAKLVNIARLIREAAARGADLTRGLLAFARRQPLQPQDVDVNALVVGASKLFSSTLGEHIEVELRLEAEPWPAFVDPSQLITALLNLALNARDAMPSGGKLILETVNVELDEAYAQANSDIAPGAYVMIAVSDSGTGIPADICDKVFEPFFTTKEVGKGTGLGLSMVYGFVKQSNGHVKIYSESGYGTTIKLYLPRAGAAKLPLDEAAAAAAVGGAETILVVEDDALVRDYVTTQLHSLGYATHVATNAAQALAIVEKETPFELLFTDVVMPGPMNGRALAAEVLKRRPQARVLFTSGYTEEAAMHTGGLDQGASLLNKPYRKAELARKIREVLRAAPQSA